MGVLLIVAIFGRNSLTSTACLANQSWVGNPAYTQQNARTALPARVLLGTGTQRQAGRDPAQRRGSGLPGSGPRRHVALLARCLLSSSRSGGPCSGNALAKARQLSKHAYEWTVRFQFDVRCSNLIATPRVSILTLMANRNQRPSASVGNSVVHLRRCRQAIAAESCNGTRDAADVHGRRTFWKVTRRSCAAV